MASCIDLKIFQNNMGAHNRTLGLVGLVGLELLGVTYVQNNMLLIYR